MNEEWFLYANGDKSGPLSFAELQAKVQSLDPGATGTLVWSASTVEWVAPEKVPGLLDGTPAPAASSSPSDSPNVFNSPIPTASPSADTGSLNPYAAPQSSPRDTPMVVGEPGNHTLEIEEAIKLGWGRCVKHIGGVIAAALIYLGISMVVSIPMQVVAPQMEGGELDPAMFGVFAILYVVNIVVSTFMGIGFIKYTISLIRDDVSNLGDLFGGAPYFFSTIGGGILLTLALSLPALPLVGISAAIGEEAMIIGVILWSLVAVGLGIRLFWFPYAIVDRKMGPIAAMKASWELTNGNWWRIIVVYIAGLGIYLLGFVALCIGALFTLPVFFAIFAASYLLMSYGSFAKR
tara:strand:- start:399 stop:1445 length:1047 start_codon:yes stop_codon:yes gene_type:complete